MANDIDLRVGINGEKEFSDSLKGIEAQIKNLNSEMKTVVASMEDMDDAENATAKKTDVLGRSMQATQKKIDLLSGQYNRTKNRLNELGRELDQASKEFGNNSTQASKAQNAYNRQAKEVYDLGTKINNATTSMKRMEKEMRDISKGAGKAENAIDDLGDEAEKTGKSLKAAFVGGGVGGLIAGGIQAIVNGISSLVDSTNEYRKIMGTLEVSSQKAGYTAAETAQTYKQLYGVLGDNQQAATATANLQALNLSQEQLTKLTDGAIGAWASYGDSIPIDSLAEAINETVQAGTVTGTFADVLNWAGTSEDAFNEKLAKANSSSERANIVLQELADQGLIEAAEGWRQNNKELLNANEASAGMEDALGDIGETLSPVVSKLKEGLTKALIELQPAIQFVIDHGAAFASAISGIGAALASLKIASVVTGIVGAVKAAGGIGAALGGALTAISGPLGWGIAAIAAIITALITLWNTNEGFRNGVIGIWETIKTAATTIFGAIANFFTVTIPEAFNSLLAFFQSIPTFFSNLWQTIGNAFINGWNAIVIFFTEGIPAAIEQIGDWFSELPYKIGYALGQSAQGILEWIGKIKDFFTETIPQLITDIGNWFKELPSKIVEGLQKALEHIVQWGAQVISSMGNSILQAINTVVGFFKELPGKIKNLLLEAARIAVERMQALGEGIINAIKSLPDRMLQIGRDIVQGIIDGITSMARNVVNSIKNFCGGLVQGFKDALGIKSPSRVLRDAVGIMIGRGIAVGIQDSTTYVLDAADKLNQKLINKEEELVEKLKDTGLDEATQTALENQLSTVKEFRTEYENALSDIQKTQENMANKLQDYGELFTTVKDETGSFIELGDLQKDIDAINAYGDALESLKNRGVSDSLLDEITSMSVDDALAYTEKLLAMTDDDYSKYMSLWEEKQKLASDIAKSFYQEEMDNLAAEYVNKLPQELGGIKNEMQNLGVNSAQGLAMGFSSQYDIIKSTFVSTISNALQAAEKAMGVHSPSRVWAAFGENLAAGLDVGFIRRMKTVTKDIASVIPRGVTSTVTDRNTLRAAEATVNGIAATGPLSTQTVIVPVYLNGKQIAEATFDPLKQVARQRGVAFG